MEAIKNLIIQISKLKSCGLNKGCLNSSIIDGEMAWYKDLEIFDWEIDFVKQKLSIFKC